MGGYLFRFFALKGNIKLIRLGTNPQTMIWLVAKMFFSMVLKVTSDNYILL